MMRAIPLKAGMRAAKAARRSWPANSLRIVMLGLCAVAMLIAAPHAALAQKQSSFQKLAPPKLEPNQPMLIQADELVYDNPNNRVTARGNVEIIYNKYTLTAERVVYDQAQSTLNAEGNVRIKQPDGALISAEFITLTDDFKDGFIRSLKLVTSDDTRIAAKNATRRTGEITEFNSGVFTPCKPCKEHPERPPTWSIKARKIIHRKTEATLEYEDARFELFGVPIAYLPRFKTADPSVKRKSGFLLPGYKATDDLGSMVEIPYYFALSPYYDFTFSPVITEKQGPLLQGKWRQRFRNGGYFIDLAGIYELDPDSTTRGPRPFGNAFRGSIVTKGDFDINPDWKWGWDITAETDDTFRRLYKLDNVLTSDRVSQVFLNGQHDRNWFGASLYGFGGLLSIDTPESESYVHPVIDYNYIYSDPVLGGELAFNSNVLSLSRQDGADNNHVISEVTWKRQFIDRIGEVITPFAEARADGYVVSNVVDPVTGVVGDQDSVARGTADIGVEYRYPFVASTANAAHVIEPIGQIVARPGTTDPNDIPNEDAQSLVFDDTLLFDHDKFSGFDRIETGTRADVGIRYTMQRNNGAYLQMLFGQSYQLAGNNAFFQDSGLETDSSDYIASLYLQPIDNVVFTGQSRFDEKTFDLRRLDLTSAYRYGPFTGALTYSNLDAQPGLGILDPREEVVANASVLVAANWSVLGQVRYDIAGDQPITDGIGLKYADDCFALSVIYQESFIRDRDIEPNQTVALRFQLKNLGSYDASIDPSDFVSTSAN